jgi:hypothetical protein
MQRPYLAQRCTRLMFDARLGFEYETESGRGRPLPEFQIAAGDEFGTEGTDGVHDQLLHEQIRGGGEVLDSHEVILV